MGLFSVLFLLSILAKSPGGNAQLLPFEAERRCPSTINGPSMLEFSTGIRLLEAVNVSGNTFGCSKAVNTPLITITYYIHLSGAMQCFEFSDGGKILLTT